MPSILKTIVAALAVAASPALAELAVTAPIDSTTCNGGQTCQVSWSDNGRGVTLAQQGNMTIALYTGGAQQQTFLQPIAWPQAVNVSTTSAVVFTVDPTVGENSDQYFIRFESTSLMQNGTNANRPYLSFSAKFTLAGMTGTFNSTVRDQIASASSTASQTATSTSTRASGTSTSRSSTSTSSTGGALKNGAGMLAAGAAVVAGVVALF